MAAVGALLSLLDGTVHQLSRRRVSLTCLRDLTVGMLTSSGMDTSMCFSSSANTASAGEPLPCDGVTSDEVRNNEHAASQRHTRRAGLIAVKAGMTQEWDHWGVRIPLTVLWVDDCQVVQIKRPEREGYLALQLGAGSKREKQVHASLKGHFQSVGIPIKRKLCEFKVSPDAELPVGHKLLASHFVAGQYVDVTGTSIGKGFQGVMKRWGFAGQPASHGNSLSHRAPGSTGQCQDPGKVFKGKKMPGRMGGVRRTTQNCLVWRVDPQRNLIYVRGQVPGHKGNFVMVRDSVLKRPDEQPVLPVPTVSVNQTIGEVTVAPKRGNDPFDYKEA